MSGLKSALMERAGDIALDAVDNTVAKAADHVADVMSPPSQSEGRPAEPGVAAVSRKQPRTSTAPAPVQSDGSRESNRDLVMKAHSQNEDNAAERHAATALQVASVCSFIADVATSAGRNLPDFMLARSVGASFAKKNKPQ